MVLAEFTVPLESRALFLAAADADACQSLAHEPGCLTFDVIGLDEDVVLFYEVYQDEAAFDHHQTTSHFQEFQNAVEQLRLTQPKVRLGRREQNGRPAD
ncbi:putative quinol monooxygenase [Tianweitania aestuarii]|uniref:putative quinol monooxygenase n=1 Tax=Tianweitania aestuarii TaxID=2814886 RepID=UPI0032656FE5